MSSPSPPDAAGRRRRRRSPRRAAAGAPLAPIAQALARAREQRLSGADAGPPPPHWPASGSDLRPAPRRKPRRSTLDARALPGGGGTPRRTTGSDDDDAASVHSVHSAGHTLQFLRDAGEQWEEDSSSPSISSGPLSNVDVADASPRSSGRVDSSESTDDITDLRMGETLGRMDDASLVSLGQLGAGSGDDDEEGSTASGNSGYFSAYLAGILAKDDEASVAAGASAAGPLERRRRRRLYIRRCARAMCTFVALAALSGSMIYLIVEEEPALANWSNNIKGWFAGGDAGDDEGEYRRLPELEAAEGSLEGLPQVTLEDPDAPHHYYHNNADRERVRKHMAHRYGPRAEHRNFPGVHPEQRYLRSAAREDREERVGGDASDREVEKALADDGRRRRKRRGP